MGEPAASDEKVSGVVHVVLFKLEERTPAAQRKALDALRSMRDRIPGLVSLQAGCDYIGSERSYDIALITRHESKQAYMQYATHPVHGRVKEVLRGLRATSVSVDFEEQS